MTREDLNQTLKERCIKIRKRCENILKEYYPENNINDCKIIATHQIIPMLNTEHYTFTVLLGDEEIYYCNLYCVVDEE